VIISEESVDSELSDAQVDTWRPGIVDATEEVRKQLLPHNEFISDIFRAYADMVRAAGDETIKRIVVRKNNEVEWYRNQMNWYGA
jgi:hypothetical protein